MEFALRFPEYPSLLVMVHSLREVLPPSVWLSAHLVFKLSLDEVETRSSQCGLKGSCAMCKTRSTKEGLLPSGSQQRASQAARRACLQTCPLASLLSPQCCADQLRCLTVSPAALFFSYLELGSVSFRKKPSRVHCPWARDWSTGWGSLLGAKSLGGACGSLFGRSETWCLDISRGAFLGYMGRRNSLGFVFMYDLCRLCLTSPCLWVPRYAYWKWT